jgi:UDP-glucose 4-epimerase
MTVLVTGSSGHLGEALMRTFETRGTPARGLDIKPSRFTASIGSIADRDIVRDAIAGVDTVIHTATLHKPHVATHSHQDFIDTNITGTLTLLEEAKAAGVKRFIFTSTTSTFGGALTPKPNEPAAWITEDVAPIPKNIYGVTKFAAENLCELFARKHRLPVILLRTSRFFPEADDSAEIRDIFSNENVRANELLYRRGDIEDMVSAHLAAVERAESLGFGRYIISATTPFTTADLALLHQNAPDVVRKHYPEAAQIFERQGWKMFDRIDRVYVNQRARRDLGWQPKYDFGFVLRCLQAGEDFISPTARLIGAKGYHDEVFANGPYPVA